VLPKRQITVHLRQEGAPAAREELGRVRDVFDWMAQDQDAGLAWEGRKRPQQAGMRAHLEIGPKRLEVLRALLPTAINIAVLLNPASPTVSTVFMRQLEPAARAMGFQLHRLEASTDRDLDETFAGLAKLHADALVIGPDTFFNSCAKRLAEMTLRNSVPTIYQYREFTNAGGLVSYGSDETEYYRLLGAYAGRILKGDKPADLPVQQSTKVELIINLKTAKTLGIAVPLSLSGRADELIE
jgi:putative ABC transport system substrate-binding protein